VLLRRHLRRIQDRHRAFRCPLQSDSLCPSSTHHLLATLQTTGLRPTGLTTWFANTEGAPGRSAEGLRVWRRAGGRRWETARERRWHARRRDEPFRCLRPYRQRKRNTADHGGGVLVPVVAGPGAVCALRRLRCRRKQKNSPLVRIRATGGERVGGFRW